jgi:hypothetical protein
VAGVPGIGSLTRFATTRSVEALSLTWRVSLDVVVSQQVIERTVNRLLSSGVAERIAERVLSGPELDRIVDRALEHPSSDRLVAHIVDSPGFERLLLSIAHSEMFDRLLDRALASEELDRVVTQIAESDEVRSALAEQSAGMADDVADQLRVRAMAADLVLERFARALIRRPPRGGEVE